MNVSGQVIVADGQLKLACHRCGRLEVTSVVYKEWLHPVDVHRADGSWLQTQLCPRCARWSFRFFVLRHSIRIGRLSSFLAPGYGACGRCQTNWQYAHHHTTMLPSGGGCFALCERCWRELTPAQRLPYYRALFDEWRRYGTADEQWSRIKAVVLTGG